MLIAGIIKLGVTMTARQRANMSVHAMLQPDKLSSHRHGNVGQRTQIGIETNGKSALRLIRISSGYRPDNIATKTLKNIRNMNVGDMRRTKIVEKRWLDNGVKITPAE